MAQMPRLKRSLISLIPNVKLTTKVPFGGKVRFLARTHKGFLVRRLTDFPHEASIFRYYAETLTPASIVFDVGANIGFHTIPLALRAARGHVVAFEPDQDNLRLLEENILLNGIKERVQVLQRAVSDSSGPVTFWRDVVSSATGTIQPRGDNSWFHEFTGHKPVKVQVESTTIDDFLKTHPTKVPTLIKIDVEGAETRVIDGMAETLRQTLPDIIVDGIPSDCAGRLVGHGYTLIDLQERRRIDASDDMPFTVLATAAKYQARALL